jgi:hypothetical protein
VYYVNEATGESTWERPAGAVAPLDRDRAFGDHGDYGGDDGGDYGGGVGASARAMFGLAPVSGGRLSQEPALSGPAASSDDPLEDPLDDPSSETTTGWVLVTTYDDAARPTSQYYLDTRTGETSWDPPAVSGEAPLEITAPAEEGWTVTSL